MGEEEEGKGGHKVKLGIVSDIRLKTIQILWFNCSANNHCDGTAEVGNGALTFLRDAIDSAGLLTYLNFRLLFAPSSWELLSEHIPTKESFIFRTNPELSLATTPILKNTVCFSV